MRKNMAVIGAFFITYLFFAFIGWEANPSEWLTEYRFIYIAVALGWAALTITYIESQENK